MSAPAAMQIEAKFQDWWNQVGCFMSPEPEARSVAHEAFQAGAAYVITHAGLNQKIATAEQTKEAP